MMVETIEYYLKFLWVILVIEVGYQRVTLPSAMPLHLSLRWYVMKKEETFDLHALDMPPAFILSQDQTLVKKVFMNNTVRYVHDSVRLESVPYEPFRNWKKICDISYDIFVCICLIDIWKTISIDIFRSRPKWPRKSATAQFLSYSVRLPNRTRSVTSVRFPYNMAKALYCQGFLAFFTPILSTRILRL